jgi:hypothetical protein
VKQDHADKADLIEFKVDEFTEDPSIGQKTKVIYKMREEPWVGVDQNTEDIDLDLYEELKLFL